jgi:hypothetical protein
MQNGTQLRNILGTDGITVDNKTINVNLAPKEAKVFVVGSAKNTIKAPSKK